MLNIFEFIENKYIQVIFANLYNDTAYGYLYCFFLQIECYRYNNPN